MFSGIIEALGEVKQMDREGTNMHLTIECPFTHELKIDQSVAHNGCCLTVVKINADENTYTVTAIKETLDRTNIGNLKVGDRVNLERCTKVGDRLDGHIVQGHVDQTAECSEIIEEDGSWKFFFRFPEKPLHVIVPKGSVTVNGTSLTVVDTPDDGFSVAIIPYTYEHTNFHAFEKGTAVNIEFDVIGKYVEAMMQHR